MSAVPTTCSVSHCVAARNAIAPAAPRAPTRTARARNWVFGSLQKKRAKRIRRLLSGKIRISFFLPLPLGREEERVPAAGVTKLAAAPFHRAIPAKLAAAHRTRGEDVRKQGVRDELPGTDHAPNRFGHGLKSTSP